MPWLETVPMDERSRCIDAYLAGGFTMKELAATPPRGRLTAGRRPAVARRDEDHECSDETTTRVRGIDWGVKSLHWRGQVSEKQITLMTGHTARLRRRELIARAADG